MEPCLSEHPCFETLQIDLVEHRGDHTWDQSKGLERKRSKESEQLTGETPLFRTRCQAESVSNEVHPINPVVKEWRMGV